MRILIVGDSFGYGCYDTEGVNTHKGIELFLQAYGYDVTNLSYPSKSNIEIYKDLKNTDYFNFDFTFIFYTNPYRDLTDISMYNKYLNIPNKSLTFKRYKEIGGELIVNYFDLLNNLKTPLFLIGGANKVDVSLLKSNYVQCLIPSLREMFYPEWEESLMVCENNRYLKKYLQKFDPEGLEELAKIEKYTYSLPNIQKEFFFPDGYHLNIPGHKILAKYLHDFMKKERAH